jgi:hypothetical protein
MRDFMARPLGSRGRDHRRAGGVFCVRGKIMEMVDYPRDRTIWYLTGKFLALRVS